jgi:hypothetical protein
MRCQYDECENMAAYSCYSCGHGVCGKHIYKARSSSPWQEAPPDVCVTCRSPVYVTPEESGTGEGIACLVGLVVAAIVVGLVVYGIIQGTFLS